MRTSQQDLEKHTINARRNYGGKIRIKYDKSSNKYNWKDKNSYHTPVLYGRMSGRLGESKFCSLRILLDSRASSSIVIIKHTKNSRNKNTPLVTWSTQGGDFHTKHITNVKLTLTELHVKKSLCGVFMWMTRRKMHGTIWLYVRILYHNSK